MGRQSQDDMVRCFLVHTVCPLPGLSAATGSESRLLYCRLVGPDESLLASEQQRELSPEERSLLQKEKVAAVARCVCVCARDIYDMSG